MKYVLTFCFFVWLAVVGRGYGQSLQTKPIPAGTTGIDLITAQPDSALFRAVSGFLETQEYVIELADEQTYGLSTELNENTEPSMRVLVSVEGGTAHFTAEGRPSDWADTDQPFTYEGETKAGFLLLSRLVDQFARSFANATIEYQTP